MPVTTISKSLFANVSAFELIAGRAVLVLLNVLTESDTVISVLPSQSLYLLSLGYESNHI